jgi:hypothetical protein
VCVCVCVCARGCVGACVSVCACVCVRFGTPRPTREVVHEDLLRDHEVELDQRPKVHLCARGPAALGLSPFGVGVFAPACVRLRASVGARAHARACVRLRLQRTLKAPTKRSMAVSGTRSSPDPVRWSKYLSALPYSTSRYVSTASARPPRRVTRGRRGGAHSSLEGKREAGGGHGADVAGGEPSDRTTHTQVSPPSTV